MAYLVTNGAAIALSLLFRIVVYLPFQKLTSWEMRQGTSFSITMLFPWLINIPFWYLFSLRLLRENKIRELKPLRIASMELALIWTFLTMAADFATWVFILPTTMRMTPGEMYSSNFPWLIMNYITIYALTIAGRQPIERRILA